jgi:flagellar motor switch protein FliN
MINQATALLIETGKVGREMFHAMRGLHRPEVYAPDHFATESTPDDAEQVEVRIELGRMNIEIDTVQTLRKGSVILFDELAEEPVNIYAGSRLVGRGEIVVVDGKIGVRIVELTE